MGAGTEARGFCVAITLAHSIPLDTLIGFGFVAPIVEFGVPFANAARERRIRDPAVVSGWLAASDQ